MTLTQVKARLIPDPRERDRKSKEQMFKTVCDVAKDLTVSAIRGAQVRKLSLRLGYLPIGSSKED